MNLLISFSLYPHQWLEKTSLLNKNVKIHLSDEHRIMSFMKCFQHISHFCQRGHCCMSSVRKFKEKLRERSTTKKMGEAVKGAERTWLETNLLQKICKGEGGVIYTMSSLFFYISSFHFTDKLLETKYALWFYGTCSYLDVGLGCGWFLKTIGLSEELYIQYHGCQQYAVCKR